MASAAPGAAGGGIFATGHNGVTGLVVGNVTQIVPQIVGILAAIVWGFGAGYILFKVLDLTMGLRVDEARKKRDWTLRSTARTPTRR